MNAKPEVLFLCHRIPYPPDKGDKIRSWQLLRFLSERFRVHLACFVDDSSDMKHAQTLEAVCESVALVPLNPLFARVRSLLGFLKKEPLTLSYYRDRRMEDHVTRLRRRPLHAEFAFSSSVAPYLMRSAHGRPRFIDLCDADSEKWRQYSRSSRGLMRFIYSREATCLSEAETDIANWAEASFAITPQEAAIFNDRPGVQRKVDWWANGVDTTYYDPDRKSKNEGCRADVVFVGAMDYRANVDAINGFVREAWPMLRKRKPDATFAIVGARPTRQVRTLHGSNGITVTGRVDDVRPWLSGAKVVIAPMCVARGIQNKVLEAMAMAKAVILTPAAAEGIKATAGKEYVVAENGTAFATELERLIADKGAADAIGRAARACVIADYDWSARLDRFGDAMKRLGVL